MPEQCLPEVMPNWREFLKPEHKTRFIWFGHSSLLLNMDGVTLLIDPFFFSFSRALSLSHQTVSTASGAHGSAASH
ncbi:MAG: hypothetical protein ACMZI0_04420 [Symbiopectobacterium sp.]|uniref:hypothetical protein n=1 Tax=Symbiopectobacterium sp. TaxID=2952789 RepID=UPI0039E807C3